MSINGFDYLEQLKEIGNIVAVTREEVLRHVKPGITTKELDELAGEILARHNAVSAPMSEYNFPGYTCISVNEEVAHGIPGKRVIQEGDVVNVDVSAKKNGVFADTGATIVVGQGTDLKHQIVKTSQASLEKALEVVTAGSRLNLIGKTIQDEVKKAGFTVIHNLTGHGIGKKLHEEPKHILNYYFPFDNTVLKEGMVLAIEPFVSSNEEEVFEANDGWTLKTEKNSVVAQFEHTVIVTKDKPIVLTRI